MDKAIPKSLHTLTVIIQVTRLIMEERRVDVHEAMGVAASVLGHIGKPDPYGLYAKARKQMGGEA